MRLRSVSWLLLLFVVPGCSSSTKPGAPMPSIALPTNTPVTFRVFNGSSTTYTLPPKLAANFIQMLGKPAIHTQISQMPALPNGFFSAGSYHFDWHGNAVIEGSADSERLWSGPLLQLFIQSKLYPKKPEEIQALLDDWEAHPEQFNAIKMDGPGAYPGGGDALHPAGLPSKSP